MFECCDCKKIYKEKPDYCDCGNNIFDEVLEQSEVKTKIQSKQPKVKKTFAQQYPQIVAFFESLDVLSVSVFVICMILSLLSLIFIKPSEQKIEANTKLVKEQKTISVPSIDELWVEKQVKLKDKQETEKTQVQYPIKKIIVKSPVKQNLKQKEQKQMQKNSSKTQSSNIIKNEQQNVQKDEQAKAQNLIETPKPAEEQTLRQTMDDKKNALAQQKKQEEREKNAQHLNNYKAALRQGLFNNLAVTSIIGSGDCVIEFSIANDGKLIDRAFAKQSPNESVNKAVYNMMMKMPYFYAPPAGYNGEKIKLHFSFKNGSYAISYVE